MMWEDEVWASTTDLPCTNLCCRLPALISVAAGQNAQCAVVQVWPAPMTQSPAVTVVLLQSVLDAHLALWLRMSDVGVGVVNVRS